MYTKEELEIEAIRRFLMKGRRERVLELLKTRDIGEGFGILAHFSRYLDLRFFTKIPSMTSDKEIRFILDEVRKYTSSNNCYVMSEDRDLDGKEINLKEALEEIVGRGIGSFLILEQGKIAYYEGETMKERYLGLRLD